MVLSVRLAPALAELVEPLVEKAVAEGYISSLFAGDAGLWGETARAEARIRLGWVRNPADQRALVSEVRALRDQFLAKGVDSFVLCGMGGSSLAPEVLAACGGVALSIVDSTHPDVIEGAISRDLSRVGVVVSSKSGGTVETDSHRRAFEAAFRSQGIEPQDRIVVVTDPGSELHTIAMGSGYRVFLGDPTIGGRFSVFSAFGLVPAGLAGVNVQGLLDDAESAWVELQAPHGDNPGLILGASLAARYPTVNKILLRPSVDVPGLGDWVEQLVAESTGKNGHGVLPVVDSSLLRATDCLSVSGQGDDSDVVIEGSVGEQMFLWLVATVFACRLLGVNPFDQPNVESAKVAARAFLSGTAVGHDEGEALWQGASLWVSPPPSEELRDTQDVGGWCRSHVTDASYVALCVFADSREPSRWSALRRHLESVLDRPVTLGFGPRFLHSTGQFHKGGPAQGVFVQMVERSQTSVPVPGRDFDFEDLLLAQARGDRTVLAESGQPVLSLVFDGPAESSVFVDALVTTEG